MPELPVGLYARVSTEDKDQNPENQLSPLREWATEAGKQYREYVDYESGKEISLTQRKEFLRMFEDLSAGRICGMAVKRPDRFSRNRTDSGNFIRKIQELQRFLYILDRELLVDKDTPKTVLANLGFEQQAAELESALLSDRVKDAYNRLSKEAVDRHEKVRWGRKPLLGGRKVTIVLPDGSEKEKLVYDVPIDSKKVLELREAGMSIRDIATELHVSTKPIWRILQEPLVAESLQPSTQPSEPLAQASAAPSQQQAA